MPAATNHPAEPEVVMLSRGRVPALLLGCGAALALAGCTAWKASHAAPDQLIANKHPHEIRITLADKRHFKMSYPSVRNDSLVGYSGGADKESSFVADLPWKYPRMSFALADVRGLEVHHVDALRTTLLIVGIGATITLIVGIIVMATMDPIGLGGDWSGGSGGSGGGEYGSCPRLSSWDGERWHLDSGTYGGAILEPLRRTDVDELEHARALDGQVRVRLSDDANETEYVDALSLVAVDHEPGTGLAPDNEGRVHSFGRLAAPLTARDFDGHDALALVRDADDRSWESRLRPRDPTNAADITDGLELSFPKPQGTHAVLVVTGHNTPWAAVLMSLVVQAHGSEEPAWQREAKAHPAETRAAMRRVMGDAMLQVSLEGPNGWEPAGIFWEAGPEVAKQQALLLDLSRVQGDLVRVRLSSIPSFWLVDRVALAAESAAPVVVQEVQLTSASDSTGQDLRPLLRHFDERTYRMTRGTVAELSFPDPPRTAGLERTYLARTSGWYRIGCDTTRAPDHALLTRLAGEPHAAAHIAVERANQALQYAEEVLR